MIILLCCLFALASLFAVWVVYLGGDESLAGSIGAWIWLGIIVIFTFGLVQPADTLEPASVRLIVGFCWVMTGLACGIGLFLSANGMF